MDEAAVEFKRIGPSHLQTAIGVQEESTWFQTCLFPTDSDNVDLVNSILSTIGGHYVPGSINNIAIRCIGVVWQLGEPELKQHLMELNQNRVAELDRYRLRTALAFMRLRGFVERFHISYEHIPPPAVNN